MDDMALFALAREADEMLRSKGLRPDKKQLRFNEIIPVAKRFYPADPKAGVRELVSACFPQRRLKDGSLVDNELYVKKDPMWKSLSDNYAWMVEAA